MTHQVFGAVSTLRTECLKFYNLCVVLVDFKDMALPPRDQRHRYLRYEGLQYTDADILDFESRLTRICRREVHRVQACRQLFDIRGPLIPDKGDLRDYWIGISSAGDFLGTTSSYTAIRDLILRMCHRLIACIITGRSQAPEKVTATDLFYLRGMDVGSVNVPYLLDRLAEHFGLLTIEILQGLTVIALKLPIIDMAKLVRLQIYMEVDTTWFWVAIGLERQPDAAAGAPGRLGRLEEEVQGLRKDVGSLHGLVERLMTNQGRFSTWMISCMAQLIEASGMTYYAFNGTFRGSSPMAFQRCIRQRIDMALPPRDQRHQYLRYEGLQYTDADILDFESRMTRIYRREVHRVQVFDFGGLSDLMADGLSARMLMKHRDA
ncbi:hypothetical protein Tco_0839523 [Tanacetum coccineum]|uniref:Uncharacterized protein n=1 Tax=Tanacetum coccineum TaxID=301880 RepID=A0ABQ5AQW0_9ASTR